jgi:hypothetical protein
MWDYWRMSPDRGINCWWGDLALESGIVWAWLTEYPWAKLIGAEAAIAVSGKVYNAAERKILMDDFAQRLLDAVKAGTGREQVASDDDLASAVPHVFELLTRRLKDGKKWIDPGSVLIFAREDCWHACLTHRGLNLKWWGEGNTFKAALDALERALVGANGQSPPAGQRTKR